jgi:hypothetical protein
MGHLAQFTPPGFTGGALRLLGAGLDGQHLRAGDSLRTPERGLR